MSAKKGRRIGWETIGFLVDVCENKDDVLMHLVNVNGGK